jgi:hypothetical protein
MKNIVWRFTRRIPMCLCFGSRITSVLKEQRHVPIEFFSPAVDHRSGDTKFLAYFFNGRIALHALQNHPGFKFGRILLPLLGCHLFPIPFWREYSPLCTCPLYQVPDNTAITNGTLLITNPSHCCPLTMFVASSTLEQATREQPKMSNERSFLMEGTLVAHLMDLQHPSLQRTTRP